MEWPCLYLVLIRHACTCSVSPPLNHTTQLSDLFGQSPCTVNPHLNKPIGGRGWHYIYIYKTDIAEGSELYAYKEVCSLYELKVCYFRPFPYNMKFVCCVRWITEGWEQKCSQSGGLSWTDLICTTQWALFPLPLNDMHVHVWPAHHPTEPCTPNFFSKSPPCTALTPKVH